MLLCKACKISIVNIDKKQGYFDPIFLPVVTITVSETRSNRVYLLNLRMPARHIINPNPRSSMVNGSGQVSTVPKRRWTWSCWRTIWWVSCARAFLVCMSSESFQGCHIGSLPWVSTWWGKATGVFWNCPWLWNGGLGSWVSETKDPSILCP